jgi:radical SAM superfamily enzyme YgiQ (UPF0313 family)
MLILYVIGITTRCETYPFTMMLVDKIKSEISNCYIILGGIQASHNIIESMEFNKNIDFIVNGEGEKTIIELFSAIEHNSELSKIKGV